MRRAAYIEFGIVFALGGLLAGCLRSGPTLGGKFCTPDSGSTECGGGFTCTTRSPSGQPLQLASPGGICAVDPPDCSVDSVGCPQDAGFWICAPHLDSSAGCFSQGAEELGGSVCMVGVAACRQFGVFQWNADGGSCVLPPGLDAGAFAEPECADAGGAAPLCLCDLIDQDCSGTPDDFPPQLPMTAKPGLLFGAGCAPDAGFALVLEPSGTDGGVPVESSFVDSCGAISLGHAYSIAELDVSEQPVTTGVCGATGAGAAAGLHLFGALEDGGLQDFGVAPLSGGKVAFPIGGEHIRVFAFCLPPNPDAPFGITGVSLKRALAPGQCDLP